VTGIGMAASNGATAPPPAPLTSSYSWVGGNTFNVSGPEWTVYDITGTGYETGGVSGGVLPYTTQLRTLVIDSTSQSKNTANRSLTVGGTPPTTIAYHNLDVGDTISCHLLETVTDSAGDTINTRYPPTGSIVIKRTS